MCARALACAAGTSATREACAPGVVVWHRGRELRVADNPLYSRLSDVKVLASVATLCAPARTASCAHAAWTAPREGPHALRFRLEATQELRETLRARYGSDLFVRSRGDAVRHVAEMAVAVRAAVQAPESSSLLVEVRYAELAGTEEQEEEERLRCALAEIGGVSPAPVQGVGSLWHPDDLPAGWQAKGEARGKKAARRRRAEEALEAECVHEPDGGAVRRRWAGAPIVMNEFRRAARASARVREPLEAPGALPPPPKGLEAGELPSVRQLFAAQLPSESSVMGLPSEYVEGVIEAASRPSHHPSSQHPLRGGEAAALDRLERFVAGGLARGADRGAAGGGLDASAKIAAYLSTGCVSPRQVHAAVCAAAAASGEADTDSPLWWVASHCQIRDFFNAQALKLGRRLFFSVPVRNSDPRKRWAPLVASDGGACEAWMRWATGRTGLPLVDAAMHELAATGYCSNRVRQNVASVLCKDLSLDWRAGAELFQFLLVDHDVGSNFGNWAYFGGVGADPKNRHFRTCSQARRYDPEGAYVALWLPALRRFPASARLWPFGGAVPGWPSPAVAPVSQLAPAEVANARGDDAQ